MATHVNVNGMIYSHLKGAQALRNVSERSRDSRPDDNTHVSSPLCFSMYVLFVLYDSTVVVCLSQETDTIHSADTEHLTCDLWLIL